MLGRLWRLARGQVRVRVTGASLPRFLNLCAFHSLTLRRMKRTAWNELYATMSVEDFRALRRYMGRTGCRVHIVRRRGAPFAAAGRALCRGAPAAAVRAVGRVFAARADRVDAVQPRLGDRNGFEPGAGRGRGDAAAGQPRRAHRRADPLDRCPEHPVEDIADAAQYDLFCAQHPRQQRDHTGGRRGAAGGEIRPERGDQGGGRAGRGDQKRTCAGRAGGCAAGRRGADRGYADQRSYAADP